MIPGRAVIIGSGLSGLTAGVLLAEHGWQVTILEAHAIAGGLMQRFRRGPYWFDTGFHFITGSDPDGIFRRIARRLGILESMRFLPLDEDSQYRIHIPGEAHFDFPVGLEASRRALCARWPEQAEAITLFFADLVGQMGATQWLDSIVPAGSPPPVHDPHDSVATILERCGVSGRAKEVIGCLASILAMKPERCTLDLYAGFAGTALAGSWRAEGGGEAMVKPLVERFRALGGRLALKRPATSIQWQDRLVTSVTDAKGEVHPCDMAISTCHPAETLRLTGIDGFRSSLAERIQATPDSDSAVLVYAALSRPPLELGRRHHFARMTTAENPDGDLYYLSPSNFHDQAEDQARNPYLEAMLWVPCDAVAAWRDSVAGKRPEAYEAWKDARTREILAAVTGLHPEIAGTITRTWASTPLSVQHFTRSRNGAAMGLSHDIGWLGSEPIPRRNRLKNLCFAGQSIGHPGVVGTMIGAFILVENIVERDLRAEVAAAAAPSAPLHGAQAPNR
ncbi:MAG: NAD(P)/FAD-dependent oxidoreductase [Planctomycetes bacterium]|nr:NAD(P)/FAD-dependent oxidoreductase [Planctomycetota bacterium]